MKKNSNILVTKASGKKEPFSEKKLRRSIKRARIPKYMEDQVAQQIRSVLYPGIQTSEIYQHIIEYLGKSETPHHQATYGLKKAIMDLGPSGYPFEKFVAAVLDRHGYLTQTNLILKGKCVEHEIDVLAEKLGKRYLIECKFHNQSGSRSDIKVALYHQARFLDLQELSSQSKEALEFYQAWIVTNTKATTQAISYAKCENMQIIGWNYPSKGSLQDIIENFGLQPITCLSTLSDDQKKSILSQGLVLCSDLLQNIDNYAQELGLRKELKTRLKIELQAVLKEEDNKNKY